jgi:hypothetical protein
VPVCKPLPSVKYSIAPLGSATYTMSLCRFGYHYKDETPLILEHVQNNMWFFMMKKLF